METVSQDFSAHYGEEGFWAKLLNSARNAGREAVETALQLYYAARSPDTPLWARTAIYSALGYFINTFDVIPDFTPVVGFVDDLTVLTAALALVHASLSPQIRVQAARKADAWFGGR